MEEIKKIKILSEEISEAYVFFESLKERNKNIESLSVNEKKFIGSRNYTEKYTIYDKGLVREILNNSLIIVDRHIKNKMEELKKLLIKNK